MARVLAAALALICLAAIAACGGSEQPDSPASSPTPVPVPTASPAPDPATPSATPTAPDQPASLEADFRITASTTGRDLLDRLRDDERACIRAALGDLLYQVLVSTPLLEIGPNTADAAPLLGCLSEGSAVNFAVAFIDARAGGWTAETRACAAEVGSRYPDAVLVNLGVVPATEDTAAETQAYSLQLYECMSDAERSEFLIRLQATLDQRTSAGRDVIAVIPGREADCVRENLTQEEFDALLEVTVHEAFSETEALSDCLSDDSYVVIFVAITDSLAGGLSGDSQSCLRDFGNTHPEFIGLIEAGVFGTSGMTEGRFRSVVEDGLGMFTCLSDGELRRMQALAAETFSRP